VVSGRSRCPAFGLFIGMGYGKAQQEKEGVLLLLRTY